MNRAFGGEPIEMSLLRRSRAISRSTYLVGAEVGTDNSGAFEHDPVDGIEFVDLTTRGQAGRHSDRTPTRTSGAAS